MSIIFDGGEQHGCAEISINAIVYFAAVAFCRANIIPTKPVEIASFCLATKGMNDC